VLAVTVRSLARHGFDARGIGAPDAALAALRRGLCPALLLTDVRLADASGVALAAEARELVPGLRVLLMSGYSASAVSPGSDDELIEKPFSPRELAERVRATLDRGR
jgi:DNA-binding response OmpR family regulator